MRTFFFIFTLLISLNSFSQNLISGIFYENEKPSEYIEVVLYNETKKPLQSTLTNSNGYFEFQVSEGEFFIEARLLGKILYTKNIITNNNVDLGIINIQTTHELDGVILEFRKKIIEQKVDRLVFNVENSVSATGSNGLDVLKLTPRIKVQNENISMIGKNNIAVMINDRILQMSGEDLSNYLRSLNAEDIKKIEVLANPPAKYSAEGNSGLINIVLKKTKKETWNTSLRSVYQQATYAKGNIGGTFNMQKGKFQYNTSVSYTNGSNAPQETNKIYYPNTVWDEVNNRRDFTDVLSVRLGMDYEINNAISTGFTYNYINNKPLIKEIDKTSLFNASNNTLDSLITTLGRNEKEKKMNSFNYHFIYTIDTIGRKLSLDFDYFNYENRTSRFFNTQAFLPNTQPIASSLEEAKNYGQQDIQNYSLNIDMEHPIDWGTFNYGGRIAITETDNLFNYFDILDKEEILNSNFSNQFNYKENTQALYFSLQKSFSEKWEAKVGVRYEFTQTEGFSKTLNQTHTNDYSKLFPTAYISYHPNDEHSFAINYGRRIGRPSFGFLNPFRFVNNPYSYSEGNPFLQPAFTDNLELEYSYKDKLITNVYYSYTDDNFEYVTILNEDNNVKQNIPLNFIVNKTYGINQTFIFKPTKWWDINASTNIYYSDTNSKIPLTLQYLSGWNGEFNLSNDIILNQNKTIFLNTSLWILTSGVDNLDYNSSDLQLNTSFKCLLLNKNLIISLNVQDIINPKGVRYTSYSNNIKNTFKNYYDEQYFRIGVIYNFGKRFKMNSRERKNQDEQNRTN
ncbi:TonB-dependent receptor domain-containing protein [Flavobacterium sp. U410]|jgi:hypothetical protein